MFGAQILGPARKRPETIIREKTETQRRQREQWVDNTTRHINTDKLLATNYQSDTRVENKRKTREQLEKEAEEKKEMERLEVHIIHPVANFISRKIRRES